MVVQEVSFQFMAYYLLPRGYGLKGVQLSVSRLVTESVLSSCGAADELLISFLPPRHQHFFFVLTFRLIRYHLFFFFYLENFLSFFVFLPSAKIRLNIKAERVFKGSKA